MIKCQFCTFFISCSKLKISINLLFSGFYWSHYCSTSLLQRGTYCPHQVQALIRLCHLWHQPRVLQAVPACLGHTTWCQWCQLGKTDLSKNPRRKGKSEAERMEKTNVGVVVKCGFGCLVIKYRIIHSLMFVQFQKRCLRRGSWQTGLGNWCSPSLWTHLVALSSPLYWEV